MMHIASVPIRELPPAPEPQEALVLFVRALARRQARIDAGLPPAANDNFLRVLH